MKILLHICCANCAVHPAEALKDEGHTPTGFWFNPNIHPYQEYKLRLDSLKGLADRWRIDMHFLEEYNPMIFLKMLSESIPKCWDDNASLRDLPNTKGSNSSNGLNGLNGLSYNLEPVPESFPQLPERCKSCYSLRLEKTAEEALKQGFDAFTTTLLISPYQDFEQIISTGNELADKYSVSFYSRDFRPYFRKSMAAAKELGVYRQKYCGCIFSREERRKKREHSKLQIHPP